MNDRFAHTDLYVDREVLKSPAFWSLTGCAPQVYMAFLTRCRRAKIKGSKKHSPWAILNNGELVFSYRHALASFGVSKDRFTHALDQLVQAGLIDIKHSGGGMEADSSRYAMSDRWRDYGTPAFRKATRPKGRKWTIPAARTARENPRGSARENPRGFLEARGKTLAENPVSETGQREKIRAVYRICQSVGEKEGAHKKRESPLPLQSGAPQAIADGGLLALAGHARGRRLSVREAKAFLKAVAEARAAGATDALIVQGVRGNKAGAPWAGPTGAKDAARALVADYRDTFNPNEPRGNVGLILRDIRHAQDYLAGRIGNADDECRLHNERVLAWAEKRRPSLEAAGWTAATGGKEISEQRGDGT